MTADTHVVFGTGPAAAFGGHTTGWDDIVTTTLDWYRSAATSPDPSPGLPEATTKKVTT